MAMASTTKIMTCILALENGQEQTVATASAKAAAAPKVHLGVREGEQFLLGDLLYSLMLESHNRRGGNDCRDHRRKCRGICIAYE